MFLVELDVNLKGDLVFIVEFIWNLGCLLLLDVILNCVKINSINVVFLIFLYYNVVIDFILKESFKLFFERFVFEKVFDVDVVV